MEQLFDVIVVGAGLAGLAATAQLTAAGRRVALVEARPRFGGRVWTRHDAGTDYPIEMGPEWFDSSGAVHQLLSGRGLNSTEADGHHFRRVGSELRDIEDSADGGEALHRRLEALDGPDRTLAAALREVGGPEVHAAAEMLRHYVEGFHAADPQRLSLEWFCAVETNQPADASELRADAGLDGAVDALLRGIGRSATVFLDTVVTEVTWAPGEVQVACTSRDASGTLRAPVAIVTLPLAVLARSAGAPGAVQFTPALEAKASALAHLATGPVIKLALLFDAPFWRDLPGLRDVLFLQDFSQPIPTWWTPRPTDAPVLIGWAAGPQVDRVGATDQVTLRHTAVRSLAHALQLSSDEVDRHLRQLYFHDWQADLFAGGGYSWVMAGGIDSHRDLAAPLADTLFFAGEATCGDGFNATMDGAILSGRRAASEVIGTS